MAYKTLNIGRGRSGKKTYISEHALVAERALGRALRDGEEVHHFDGNPKNNAPTNLVICPSRSYHMLLHMRQRALDACGNADWLPCYFCKKYDSPEALRKYIPKGRVTYYSYHIECQRTYDRRRRLAD